MADLAALAEARSLLDYATDLMRRIDAEIRDAEATRRKAQESLEQVQEAGKAASEHVGFLGAELRQGMRKQKVSLAALADGAEAGRAFWESALPELTALPTLASPAHIPSAGPRTFVPDLPSLTIPSAEEIRRIQLSEASNLEVWDLFAEEVSTFQDVFEKTLAALDQAETVVEQPRDRRERRRKETSAGKEVGTEKDRRHP